MARMQGVKPKRSQPHDIGHHSPNGLSASGQPSPSSNRPIRFRPERRPHHDERTMPAKLANSPPRRG